MGGVSQPSVRKQSVECRNHCRHWRDVVQEFISEDDLKTFEGWLRYQGIDAATSAPEELEKWRGHFYDARGAALARPHAGARKSPPRPREKRDCMAAPEGG